MTQQILEQNKLLNQFLGYKYHMTESGYNEQIIFYENMSYLLEVVDKIEKGFPCETSLNYQGGYSFHIDLGNYNWNAYRETRVEAIYACILEFVSDYLSNPEKYK